jgi:G3E family GTPase
MPRLLVLLATAHALAPTPITLLSGFLGAGKTTLLERLLKNDEGLRIGCLVNDVASLDVDGAAAAAASNEALVVTMSNGCACCTARDGLVDGVRRLRRAADFDHIVVEATGVAEPAAMRDALAACGGLDTLVTVVDASVFAKGLWATGARVLERRDLGLDGLTSVYDVLSSAGLWRGVADLLAEQVECADIILLNKVDAASDGDVHDAERICRALNPDATVRRVTRCDVPLKEVLGAMGGTGAAAAVGAVGGAAFFAPTLARPPRLDAATHVYERDRPFSPERFGRAVEAGALRAAYRSKGSLWLASAADRAYAWSQAGGASGASPACGIWAAAPRTQVAFVGAPGIDFGTIDDALDACLLTDRELALYELTPDDEQRGWNFPVPEELGGVSKYLLDRSPRPRRASARG